MFTISKEIVCPSVEEEKLMIYQWHSNLSLMSPEKSCQLEEQTLRITLNKDIHSNKKSK